MIQNQLMIIGTLESFEFALVGKDNNFPVAKIRVGTGEKFYDAECVSQDAVVLNALVSEMPTGTNVRVLVSPQGRRTADGGVFTTLQLRGLALDFSGKQGGAGLLTGYVAGVEEREGKNGNFEVPQLGLVLADRDGLIPDAKVEIRFPRDGGEQALADWKAHKGDMVEIEVDIDAYISSGGRSYPRYTAKKISYHDFPSYARESLGLEEGAMTSSDPDLDLPEDDEDGAI